MKAIKTLFFMLLCSLALPIASFAKTNQLLAQYDRVSGKYRIDIEDRLFSIENLEDGENYTSSILFKNTTSKRLGISLTDVNNLLTDERLYDLSKITFSDGKVLYSGDMDNAKFHFSLSPNEERLLTVTYHVDKLPHQPDNSLMGAKMHSEFIFVGTFENEGTSSQVIASGYIPETPSSETLIPPVETTASGQAGSGNATGTPTVTVKIPKTGDEFPIIPLFSLLIFSVIALVLLRKDRDK